MLNKKIIKFIFYIISGLVGSVIFFNNCSKSSFSTQRDESSFIISSSVSEETSDSNHVISCMKKNLAGNFKVTTQTKKYSEDLVSNGLISKDQTLIVKLDHQCLINSSSLSYISNMLKNRSEGLFLELKTGSYKFNFIKDLSEDEFSSLINSDPCIVYIDKNVTFTIDTAGDTNDSYYSSETHLTQIGHPLIYKKIFNRYNGINKEVRIAIIDSGVDTTHPDLKDNILRDLQDQVIGLNAIDNNLEVADSGFHGTHVAGLAAAVSGNSIGVSGVLGSFVKIIPIRVSKDGSSVDLDAVINGINWATKQKADVINMSLSAKGAAGNRPLLKEAIKNAIENNVVIVVAAGNDGVTITENSNTVPMTDCNGMPLKNSLGQTYVMDTAHVYPMKYASSYEGLISVGSTDAITGAISCFSNRSSTFVEIMAPGSAGNIGIISTVPTRISNSGYANHYGASPINGTSMSSPVVAGAAALAIALAKSRGYVPSAPQIEKLLTTGSQKNQNLSTFAKNGQILNLISLVNLIDSDTKISSSSSQDRSESNGTIKISIQPQDQKAIIGDPLNLSVQTTTDSSILINYQWYRNDKPLAGANSQTLLIAETTASHAGEYYVELTAGQTKVKSKIAVVTLAKEYCQ